MSKEEMPTKKLGRYKNRIYYLYTHVKPSFNKIKKYVITIYHKTKKSEKQQIARFDDSHGFKHFDKLFQDHPYKNFWQLY
jgi:hypothetical protein